MRADTQFLPKLPFSDYKLDAYEEGHIKIKI